MIHINLADDLTTRVKKDALRRLEKEPAEFLYRADSPLKNFIAFLYSENIIKEEELRRSLEVSVFSQGFQDYDYLVSYRGADRNAEDLPYPKFLVHTIERGVLKEKEIKKLRFYHDESVKSFCRTFEREDLIGDLIGVLRETEPKRPGLADENDKTLLDQLEADDFIAGKTSSKMDFS